MKSEAHLDQERGTTPPNVVLDPRLNDSIEMHFAITEEEKYDRIFRGCAIVLGILILSLPAGCVVKVVYDELGRFGA